VRPAREQRERSDRSDRDFGDRGDRPGRFARDDRPESAPRRSRGGTKTTYRIAVGKRHRVEPRQIVGALANEGGLSREDFGVIQIRPDFSLVELPADLSADTLARLADTRISGKLIELRPDTGGSPRRSQDDRPPRKPRHTS
jgi:ATP-dependent RNA helicase DeaD